MNIKPYEHLGMALGHIYIVYGDSGYFMQTKRVNEKWLAAIRTVNGSGFVDVAGYGRIKLEANSLLLAEVSNIRYNATEGQKWDFYWFEFSPDAGAGFPWYEVLTVSPQSWERAIVRYTFNLLSLPDTVSRTAATSFFDGLLHDWALRWQRFGKKPCVLREIVFRAISRMQEDFSKPVVMKMLAEEFDISERWLYHAFIDTLGVSPRTYYTNLRMQHAAHALSTGFGTITEIADHLGYSNSFHFSRAFKMKFGCNPSDYVRFYGNQDSPSEGPKEATSE